MKRLLMVGAILMFSACGGTAATGGAASPCMEAFAAAAGVDEMADTVSHLYPAVRACTTIEAWTAAYDAHDGAGFIGSATDVLANVCSAPEIADAPLCGLVE